MSKRTLTFSAVRLLQTLQSLPAASAYIVAYSGGADSTALLHAISTIKHQIQVPVSAMHVNHGIHDDADNWQLRCEEFCRRMDVELITRTIELDKKTGKGLEAEARHMRYAAMQALLPAGASLLTAHHADDQAETLLLNLMRGSGVDGLSAMPEHRSLGRGFLQRPLLEFKNRALKIYLHEHGIDWTEDPSNQFLNHDRNFMRHEVIPLLETRWPEISKRLLLTQRAMSDARHLLEKVADNYLQQHLSHPFVLQIKPQLADEPEMFKLAVRRWTHRVGTPAIPAYRLEIFHQQVAASNPDQKVTLGWDGWLLRLYRQKLWLQTNIPIAPCPAVKWPAGSFEVDLGVDTGLLLLRAGQQAINQAEHPSQPQTPNKLPAGFSISGRIHLKDIQIAQRGQHKRLKNLLQAAGIPPWLRDCIPLCKLGDELVAIGDWCFDQQFSSWLSEHQMTLRWKPRHPLLQFIHSQQQTPTVDPAGAVR